MSCTGHTPVGDDSYDDGGDGGGGNCGDISVSDPGSGTGRDTASPNLEHHLVEIRK